MLKMFSIVTNFNPITPANKSKIKSTFSTLNGSPKNRNSEKTVPDKVQEGDES